MSRACGAARPAARHSALAGRPLPRAAANGARCRAFFNFGKKDDGAPPPPPARRRVGPSALLPMHSLRIASLFTPSHALPPPHHHPHRTAPPALSRADYSREEVEDYYNYMGMLAEERTYDRMERLLASGLAPVDLLLLMAAAQNDAPKVEELLRAGADPRVTAADYGSAPVTELCSKAEVRELLEAALAAKR